MASRTAVRREPSIAKGRERFGEILDAAERILVRRGAEGLTLRAVAEMVGISLGNLQYYLPTRAALFEAVFARHGESFRTGATQAVDADADARDRLLALVDFWLSTHHDPEQSLFWQLWAMSAHDATANRVMRAAYDETLDHLASELREIHPRMRAGDALRRAAAIASLVEGTSLFVGRGRRPRRELRELHDEIRADVRVLVERPPTRVASRSARTVGAAR